MSVLLCSFVVWQGCGTEKHESARESTARAQADSAATQKAEAEDTSLAVTLASARHGSNAYERPVPIFRRQ